MPTRRNPQLPCCPLKQAPCSWPPCGAGTRPGVPQSANLLGCRIAHGFRRCRGFGGSKLIFFLEAWSKTAVRVRPNSHAISGVGVSSFASFLSNLSSCGVQCLLSRFGGFCRDIATSIFHEVCPVRVVQFALCETHSLRRPQTMRAG